VRKKAAGGHAEIEQEEEGAWSGQTKKGERLNFTMSVTDQRNFGQGGKVGKKESGGKKRGVPRLKISFGGPYWGWKDLQQKKGT